MDKFQLPRQIEHYLATLSKVYAQQGNRQLQELLVNSQVRVDEGTSYDNWNGGISGHAIYLSVPEALYLTILPTVNDARNQIKEDLERLHNVKSEFFEDIFIEMEETKDQDWRKSSGLLIGNQRSISHVISERIWGKTGYRVFLSHRSDSKKETAKLKTELQLFGISAFVAHEDIHPTKAWQDEIDNALSTMDAFVALMTPDFHESEWTDQEVGFALARGVPMIAANLGRDPYGFMGKFQALPTDWLSAALDIAKILISNDRMVTAYIKALPNCPSYDDGNTLAKLLPKIEKLSISQIDQIIECYNSNNDIRGSYGFDGRRPVSYGPGLVHFLEYLDPTRDYNYNKFRFINAFPKHVPPT